MPVHIPWTAMERVSKFNSAEIEGIGCVVCGQVQEIIPEGTVVFTILTLGGEPLYFGELRTKAGTTLYEVDEVKKVYASCRKFWNIANAVKLPEDVNEIVFSSWENAMGMLMP